jgi:acetyltransferase-like isoleucine patch superfamily enzyme
MSEAPLPTARAEPDASGMLGRRPRVRLMLIALSGWCHHLLYLTLDLMPPPFRSWAFHLLLKSFGKGSWIDYGCFIRYPWTVRVGSGTVINHGCRFYGSYLVPGVTIEIGDSCAIAPNVCIYAAGHDTSAVELRDVGASVRIGNHVWIGGGATLLPGVQVGDGAVIGAGALVARDVPAYTVLTVEAPRALRRRDLG